MHESVLASSVSAIGLVGMMFALHAQACGRGRGRLVCCISGGRGCPMDGRLGQTNGVDGWTVAADTLVIPGWAWVDEEMVMACRLIARVEGDGDKLVAHVYRDTEWQEFVVEFLVDGVVLPDASYHTDLRKDAIDTANAYVRG